MYLTIVAGTRAQTHGKDAMCHLDAARTPAAAPHKQHLPVVRTTFSADERLFQPSSSPHHFAVPDVNDAAPQNFQPVSGPYSFQCREEMKLHPAFLPSTTPYNSHVAPMKLPHEIFNLPVARVTFSAETRTTRIAPSSAPYHFSAETNGKPMDKLRASRSCENTCLYDGKRT